MSSLYENIRKRRKELGLSQEDLAKKMGYTSRSTIAKIELGQNDIPQSKIMAFAKALNTTTSYLMGLDEEKNDLSKYGFKPIKTYKVPLLGTIACGEPILAQENIEDYIDADEEVRADFALKCKGDSMINARIFDGDIVYIHQQPDVENGEIAAVLIDDEATLKRVYKYENRIELRAENPTFKPLNYEGEQLNEIRIIGKAVAFLSGVI